MKRGFLLIDALLGLAVASILTTVFLDGVTRVTRLAIERMHGIHAEVLALELVEIVRDIERRAVSYPFAECASACVPDGYSGEWILSSSVTESLGRFSRHVRVESVERNADFDIVPSGTEDTNTFKVVAIVDWNSFGEARTVRLDTYVYDLYDRW